VGFIFQPPNHLISHLTTFYSSISFQTYNPFFVTLLDLPLISLSIFFTLLYVVFLTEFFLLKIFQINIL